MKEAPLTQSTLLLHKTRSGSNTTLPQRIHERGDKVVVNGAKESLLSILRKHVCQCGKHTLEKLTTKFLSLNKVAASYDILINCDSQLYSHVLREYLLKMNKKKDEDETHQSLKYIESKKKTLQKFIQSAEELDVDYIDEESIQKSVGALYSKGKSRESAVGKINVYLNKINFENCLTFQESSCSFKFRNSSKSDEQISVEETQIRVQVEKESPIRYEENQFSQRGEQKICNLSPLQDEQTEEISLRLEENQASKSYRVIPKQQPYDLFDELIQDESISDSFLTDYFNNQ